jgi:hypothetical protein
MADEVRQDDLKQFHLTFSLDRDGFFRRSCPSCGRDFKTQVNDADLVTSLEPAFRQMGLKIGAEPSERDTGRECLYCPYCEHHAESGDMLTGTFIAYLRRYAMREYILPVAHKLLSSTADAFTKIGKSSSRGMLRVQATVPYDRLVLPPRPISGPEPPDMMAIELLCCGKKAKIVSGWLNPVLCPYCGTKTLLQ